MPKSLSIIPSGVRIVDTLGAINEFFRFRWEELRSGFQTTPTVAGEPDLQKTGQTAALATTALYTTKTAGLYRLSYYMRKTVADGVSSSLTVTWGWTESGTALTEAQPALTTDTTAAEQSGSKLVYADANTNLTIAVAYASNTPNRMTWRIDNCVELLA